jgi:hypothetical protein
LVEIATERILQQCPKANIHRLEVPPVTGAVLLAFDACNVDAPTIKLEGKHLSHRFIPTGNFD